VHDAAHAVLTYAEVQLPRPVVDLRERHLVGHEDAGVSGQVRAAADETGHDVKDGIKARLRRVARRDGLVTDGPHWQLVLPTGEAGALQARLDLALVLRPLGVELLPSLPFGDPTAPGLAVVLEHVTGAPEVDVLGNAEDLLGRLDLVLGERV